MLAPAALLLALAGCANLWIGLVDVLHVTAMWLLSCIAQRLSERAGVAVAIGIINELFRPKCRIDRFGSGQPRCFGNIVRQRPYELYLFFVHTHYVSSADVTTVDDHLFRRSAGILFGLFYRRD